MSPTPHNPELRSLESALGQLAPSPSRLDRDRLMFEAGRAAVRHPTWAWPSLAAALALLAVGLGTALMLQPIPQTVYVYLPPESQGALHSTSPVVDEMSVQHADYLKLRTQVLQNGVDALPRPVAFTYRASGAELEAQLGLPPDTLDRRTLIGGQRF